MNSVDANLRQVIGDVLALSPARIAALAPESALLGALPELDSMAIATLFAAIEDRLGLVFEDDDLSAETLASYGSLLTLVTLRRAA